MTNSNNDIPTIGFGPFGLFLVASITIITLSIVAWIKKTKERKAKKLL